MWSSPTRAGVTFAFAVVALSTLAQAHEPQQVVIRNLVFTAPDITLHVGNDVEWVNTDAMAHTARSKPDAPGGKWDTLLPPKTTVKQQMNTAGVFVYDCRFHPNMKGRITVLAK